MAGVKYLVTGAGGMVGSHLVEELERRGESSVVGTYYKPTVDLAEIRCHAELIECDVRYPNAVNTWITTYKPQIIFHLAAQSYPTVSWARPNETMHTNVNGTINVFEAIKKTRQIDTNYDPMVVVACSSAQYGAALNEVAATEKTPCLPLHPYGVSKVAQDLLAYQYFVNDNIRTIRARIFNTTGARKQNDVVSDFSARVAAIARGECDTLRVGNLKSRRAILDAHDLIRALLLLSEKGEPGEAYNICADHICQISDLVEMMRAYVDIDFETYIDPNLLRPTDEAVICGNNNKLKQRTGWAPQVTLEETVAKVVDYYRDKVGKEQA